ncbi:MAG: TlyA family RNA methyltransferase [Candidatus Gracilibacteria bacterium]|nr:TlyA family RNA methyltransferase [Candidatus Gracilibacteria bacterium]
MRIDQYVTEKNNITKNKAQAMIKAGAILVNNKIITKCGFMVKETDEIEISETEESKYVSRSAIKLKKYFENFPQKLTGKTALDIGSSTGGFCQILLENEIQKIYAVDVGTSQLHQTLRNKGEIVSLENTDIRDLRLLPEKIDIITCDVSFIKLEMILDAIIYHIQENTKCFLLFKPQFEVGKNFVNKKGVVKNDKYTIRELNNFLDICRAKGLKILQVENSEMKGENGNQEIFIELIKKEIEKK